MTGSRSEMLNLLDAEMLNLSSASNTFGRVTVFLVRVTAGIKFVT